MIAAAEKEARNTEKKDNEDATQRRNLHEFNVMSTECGITLSSTQIKENSNQIPEMQKIMKQIDCRGCVVTADSMNTQKMTTKIIIEEAHENYCLALKENQKTAYLEGKILCLARRFVMFIIKLLKVYYHRSMKRIRNKISRNP